jgi:4-hydroxy-tetrahydrodipicolinate reductase
MMRALIVGYGKMGHLIAHLAAQYNIAISGVVDHNLNFETVHLPQGARAYAKLTDDALDSCDIAIDFSHAKDICERIEFIAARKKPVVVGTTGWEKYEKEAKKIVSDNHSALLYSPNFSLGVALFSRLVSYAGELFSAFGQYDVGILETHHRQKQDAPSGTALLLSQKLMQHYPDRLVAEDLPRSKGLESPHIHLASLRIGFHPGTHEVVFDSQEDTITLAHRARNREGFARGALEASYWLVDKKGWYTLDDMIEEKLHKRAK